MIHRFAALTVAGFGLIFIAANPTEVPPTSTASSSLTSPSNLASTTEEALSLSIDYDAAKKSFQLSFEATDREQYYLLEGRGSLTQGDWQVGYGIKGTGIPMTTPMGADSDKGFYRLSRTGSDDDRLQVDFDGDRVVLLDELDRGLAGFEEELADDDKDLIPNDFEVVNGLNPADATDASGDVDGDGVSNANEYKLGDDPNREEADRFTMSINMKYEVQYYFQSEINVVEFSALYSNKHETGEAHTTGHQSRYLLPNVEGGYEWNIDAKTWVQFSFCFYHKERTDPYLEIEKSRGYYQILSCIGSPITFLIQQTQYTYVEGSRGRRWTKPTENTEKSYEVVHWNGKELTIDGEPVSLPTGERGCKYRYGLVRLPYRVDLDILHPATGKLEENLEDKDHDSEGGYVALKREIDGEDVAPVTQLQLSSSSPYEMKYRLKFDSGGRYRIYKDADRTEEVFTEDTEFPAGTATTVYLQGLKKSDASGGEKVTLQISLDDTWFDTDSVNFTVYSLEFKNEQMSGWKSTSMKPSVQARIGVIKGDAIDFHVCDGASESDSSGLSWTSNGQPIGSGASLSHTFDATGSYAIEVATGALSLGRTTVTVDEATGPGQVEWFLKNITRIYTGPLLRDEALDWASSNAANLGGGLHNGNADAARHAYWSGIMTIDWNAVDAAGLSTAHEVTNLNGNGFHNETVMDLENNADGISMASAPSVNRALLESAIETALNSENLTVLDNTSNQNGSGLLQPSSQ